MTSKENTPILKSHISRIYSPDTMKKLFAHSLLIDMEDNNEKVEVIKELLGDEFAELGSGTNRYGTLGPDGMCHKIALDRRGIVDNITEFKRSPDIEWCSPKVYETNGVVLVSENVELITKEDFIANRENILDICERLSRTYIFTDIGFAGKNFCNWGINRKGVLVILDTGYLIPRIGNEEAMTCPICHRELKYNRRFTGFICTSCSVEFSFIDIYRRLDDSLEKDLYQDMTGFELPDFSEYNNSLYNNGIMKGGHIFNEIDKRDKPVDDNDTQEILRAEDIEDILKTMHKD